MSHRARQRARQLAASAPLPDPETVARLRALLGVAPMWKRAA
jgi:hypothetical protein